MAESKPLVWKSITKTKNTVVEFEYQKLEEAVKLKVDGEFIAVIPIEYLYDFVSMSLLVNATKRIGTARRAFQLRHSVGISLEELEAGMMGELDE